jgi:hypothetical protein
VDDERAFDAVESYLCEISSEPSSDWRTVSLVTALRGLITRGPEFQRSTLEARREAIKATAAELTDAAWTLRPWSATACPTRLLHQLSPPSS